jgi:opacity protein-like surface antigen
VSGFVGSDFGGSTTTDPSVSFGGQLAYMWKGVIGAEALADFAPSIKIDRRALAEHPQVNSYMANMIFAIPLGGKGQFEPYISGGVGGIQLRARILNLALANPNGTPAIGTSDSDRTKLGTDLGGGVMGFAGTIGFRADVRYYKAPTDTTLQSTSAVGLFTEGLLSGLSIWRANIGVAVRW